MKRFAATAVILSLLMPLGASAQGPAFDVIDQPICFLLRNEAPYGIQGHVVTEKFPRPDGVITEHRANFRLKAAGSINEETGYPTDRAQFCSSGPFFPGRQLELTLKTLIPIFSCRTRIDQGDVIVKGYRKPEGGANTWAECFNADGTKTGMPER